MNDKVNAHHAHCHRLLQAAAYIELYRRANGHGPESIEDMKQWRLSTGEKPIDPYKVLTQDQIREELKGHHLVSVA